MEIFAERELDLLNCDGDSAIEEFRSQILAIVEAFGKSGQSGGSAPIVAAWLGKAITDLCLGRPLNPIEDTPDQWVNVARDDGEALFQHVRDGRIFKRGDNMPTFLDAIVYRNQAGITFTSGKNSALAFKQMPANPQTFYVDVVEFEHGNDCSWILRDPTQLDAVAEVYDISTISPNVFP